VSKDVKDFSALLFEQNEPQLQQITEGMEIDPTALLRRLHDITIDDQQMTIDETKVIITVKGTMGIRKDTGTAAEMLTGLVGRDWNNAVKACETVAKRRLTTNLLGYGYKHSLEEQGNFAAATVAEPQRPDVPGPVNSAPATVVPDTRDAVISVVPVNSPLTMTMADLPASPVLVAPTEVVKVPFVTEATLASMHNEAKKSLDTQHTPANEAVAAEVPLKKPSPPMSSQVGFFDEPVPPGATQVESVVPQQVFPVSVPMTVGDKVETSPGVVETVAASGTSSPEPEPVQDIKLEPATSTAPTQQQYRGIQVRCTKLVRDVLPKAGKGADSLFLPYVRKRLGTNELQKGSLLVWEEMLAQLELLAVNPKDLAQFLNGGKVFSGK